MMRAEVGFIPNVTGIRSAIPAEGPMPGSTPMIVPRKTPMKVYQRLIGCRQTANPLMMCVRVSTALPLERQYPRREIRAEELDEHDSSERVRHPFALVEIALESEQIDRRGDDEAEELEYEEVQERPHHDAGD